MGLTLEKRELRRRMIALRARQAGREAPEAAKAAALHFPLHAYRLSRVVSAFHRMGTEIDPGPLMDRLATAGARLCLPVVVERGGALVFRACVPFADLVPDAAGVAAPPLSSPALRPDLVLAPLLAFDAKGWRLGYGGGYYDRTLAMLRRAGPVSVVGLAFACQEVAAVPHGPEDERLDAILTETGYRPLA